MKRHLRTAIAAALLWFGAGGVEASTQARFYKVFTAEARGFVFYADGQTPAAEVPVRVWDLGRREFIYETLTDEDGAFELPKLEPGQYFVTFDSLKLELAVADLTGMPIQQPHDIIVIVPRVAASVPLIHLHAVLVASTISEGAFLYRKDDRRRVVSP